MLAGHRAGLAAEVEGDGGGGGNQRRHADDDDDDDQHAARVVVALALDLADLAAHPAQGRARRGHRRAEQGVRAPAVVRRGSSKASVVAVDVDSVASPTLPLPLPLPQSSTSWLKDAAPWKADAKGLHRARLPTVQGLVETCRAHPGRLDHVMDLVDLPAVDVLAEGRSAGEGEMQGPHRARVPRIEGAIEALANWKAVAVDVTVLTCQPSTSWLKDSARSKILPTGGCPRLRGVCPSASCSGAG